MNVPFCEIKWKKHIYIQSSRNNYRCVVLELEANTYDNIEPSANDQANTLTHECHQQTDHEEHAESKQFKRLAGYEVNDDREQKTTKNLWIDNKRIWNKYAKSYLYCGEVRLGLTEIGISSSVTDT